VTIRAPRIRNRWGFPASTPISIHRAVTQGGRAADETSLRRDRHALVTTIADPPAPLSRLLRELRTREDRLGRFLYPTPLMLTPIARALRFARRGIAPGRRALRLFSGRRRTSAARVSPVRSSPYDLTALSQPLRAPTPPIPSVRQLGPLRLRDPLPTIRAFDRQASVLIDRLRTRSRSFYRHALDRYRSISWSLRIAAARRRLSFRA
jgi:hypothetical protein